MNTPYIHRLKISNFKSIDTLELKAPGPFGVFAGANGSGKTNFFDALVFFSRVMQDGARDAVQSFGGLANIRNASKSPSADEPFFSIEIECQAPPAFGTNGLELVPVKYFVDIFESSEGPVLQERLVESGNIKVSREKRGGKFNLPIEDGQNIQIPVRDDYSIFFGFKGVYIVDFAQNIRVFRIDPLAASTPSNNDGEDATLEPDGRNLAAILGRMESDKEFRETILEWMELIVPSIDDVKVEQQRLDQRSNILFREGVLNREFPARLVSQGTIYALSLLVAILDKPHPSGITLIEEPERGLHPKAIGELIRLMREMATPENGIWVTTHSETVVRESKLSELWLVDRKNGQTTMKHASDGKLTEEDIRPLGMDDAWLSNLLGAGLPW